MPLFSFSGMRSFLSSKKSNNRILHECLPIKQGECLKSDLMNSAVDFWFAHRQDNAIPEWSAFRPEQHPNLLPNIILYQRVDGPRYITRVVGGAIHDYLPTDPIGKFIDEVMPTRRLRDVTMRLDRAFSDGLPNYVEKSNVWQKSSSLFNYNALSMPFISRDTGIERVLCVLEFDITRLED